MSEPIWNPEINGETIDESGRWINVGKADLAEVHRLAHSLDVRWAAYILLDVLSTEVA
jgi:hypothetical protein